MKLFAGLTQVAILLLISLAPDQAFGALALVKDQDMTFPDGAPGDVADVLSPTTETTIAARFTITGGQANRAYTITLPANTTLVNGANTIGLTTWRSNPANSVTTNGSGTASFYVGATRAALAAGQVTGTYTRIFTVTVTRGATSANQTATASINVIASISAVKVADLRFGGQTRGDPAETIVAGSSSSAQFTVSGQPSKSYTITLPANGVVIMTTGGGGSASRRIAVNNFTSSPTSPGTLSAGGTQTLYVGATRAAILANQVQGAYTTSFTVTLTYQ